MAYVLGTGLFEERKFTVMSTEKNQNIKRTTYWLCITAVFMALNVAMSSFGIPVPGGHLYMNDIIICTAAIILDPLAAFMVGGVGAFLRARGLCLRKRYIESTLWWIPKTNSKEKKYADIS